MLTFPSFFSQCLRIVKNSFENCVRIRTYKYILLCLFKRYLVASRDLRPGELIMAVDPVVVGPPQGCQPLCLGCYKKLDLTENAYRLVRSTSSRSLVSQVLRYNSSPLCCPGARAVLGLCVAGAARDEARSTGTVGRSANSTKECAPSCWQPTAMHSRPCTWSSCPYGAFCFSNRTLTSGALCSQWRRTTRSAGNCRSSGTTTRRMWWTGSGRSGA